MEEISGNISYVLNNTYVLKFTGKYVRELQDEKRKLYIKFIDNPNYEVRSCQIEFTCGKIKLATPKLNTRILTYKFDPETGNSITQSIVPYFENYNENLMTVSNEYEQSEAVLNDYGDNLEYWLSAKKKKNKYLVRITLNDTNLYTWDENAFFADGYYHSSKVTDTAFASAFYDEVNQTDSRYYVWKPSNTIFYAWGIKQAYVDMSQYYKKGADRIFTDEVQEAPITLSGPVTECTSTICRDDNNMKLYYKTSAKQVSALINGDAGYMYCISHKSNGSVSKSTIDSSKYITTSTKNNVILLGQGGDVPCFPSQNYVTIPWRIVAGTATVQLTRGANLKDSNGYFVIPVNKKNDSSFFPTLSFTFNNTTTTLNTYNDGMTGLNSIKDMIIKVEGNRPTAANTTCDRWYYYDPAKVSIAISGSNSSYIEHSSQDHRFGIRIYMSPNYLNANIQTFNFKYDGNEHEVLRITAENADKVTINRGTHPAIIKVNNGKDYTEKTETGKKSLWTRYSWNDPIELTLTIPEDYRFSDGDPNLSTTRSFKGEALGGGAIAIYACAGHESGNIVNWAKSNNSNVKRIYFDGNRGYSYSKVYSLSKVSYNDLWGDNMYAGGTYKTPIGKATLLILYQGGGRLDVIKDPDQKGKINVGSSSSGDKSLLSNMVAGGGCYQTIVTVTLESDGNGSYRHIDMFFHTYSGGPCYSVTGSIQVSPT